jgi:hypothetical protein
LLHPSHGNAGKKKRVAVFHGFILPFEQNRNDSGHVPNG